MHRTYNVSDYHTRDSVRCGHTGEKKNRTAKPMERCMQERHDRSGSERGQHDKQGRMEEEEDNQLYRRHQMTGQAREEEEDHTRDSGPLGSTITEAHASSKESWGCCYKCMPTTSVVQLAMHHGS